MSSHAQFYDLDGTYHCVTAPDAACKDRLDAPQKSAVPPTLTQDPPPRLDDVIARVKQRAATAADIRLLENAVAAKDARAVEVMARDEANGAPASQVAAAIQRVLESGRPPRRVSAGKTAERAGLVDKRLLPFRVFEAAAKPSLGVR